jgi:hypothetical protein
MNDFGFKMLSPENWLEPEWFMGAFKTIKDSTISDISQDDWFKRFFKAQLDRNVPLEIRKLFEVARGAATYGYFFYPLYTLAGQQLYRVVEAAVSVKCKSMGASRRTVRTFQDKLFFLRAENIIPQGEWIWWDSIRELRNHSSHPKVQTIVFPQDTLYDLSSIAKHINDLFAEHTT